MKRVFERMGPAYWAVMAVLAAGAAAGCAYCIPAAAGVTAARVVLACLPERRVAAFRQCP